MQKDMKQTRFITCPYCGTQYLPDEIFMPTDIIGHSQDVVRDATGKIIYYEYRPDYEPNTAEKYICDNCGSKFVVETTTTYRTKKEAEELDFTNQYTSLISD